MFQRIGPAAYKTDLSNTLALCTILGNPQDGFQSIHVAGTNGKGSVAHFLAAILQESGYTTGLFTSPHLSDFRERIRINGKLIPKQKVIDFVEKYRLALKEISPSFFEYTAGLAFKYFVDEKVDIAILETGMGGRLDSTNVVNPLLSVITQIGFDHMAFLGDTLEKIAVEKAGIIKKNTPVVIGVTQKETTDIFREIAARAEAPIYFADSRYRVEAREMNPGQSVREMQVSNENPDELMIYKSGLTGDYQCQNLPAVLMATDLLKNSGFKVPEKAIRKGIREVVSLTGIRGRWEILGKKPLIICDTGHNEDGLKAVAEQIRKTPHEYLHFVLGTVNDKEISGLLRLLPKDARYYFCKAGIPRALDEQSLKEMALDSGLQGESYPTVKMAFDAAKQAAGEKDLVFVGGSTFVVAEVV